MFAKLFNEMGRSKKLFTPDIVSDLLSPDKLTARPSDYAEKLASVLKPFIEDMKHGLVFWSEIPHHEGIIYVDVN